MIMIKSHASISFRTAFFFKGIHLYRETRPQDTFISHQPDVSITAEQSTDEAPLRVQFHSQSKDGRPPIM